MIHWLFIMVGVLIVHPVVAAKRPNVLMISVDDMNDWTSVLGGYAGKVHTPNLERLAKRAVNFTNAHTASPVCCPSRTALLLGQRPSTTGIYNNGQWWRPHLPKVVSLPMCFRQNGYRAFGSGKVFHHTAGFNPPDQWDDFQRLVFRDDPWFRGHRLNYPWSKPVPYPKGYPFSGILGTPHEGDWGVIPSLGEKDYDDAKSVNYAINLLAKKHDRPFFLACGIFRPHLPWYAPKRFFDLYPLKKIRLPDLLLKDLSDVPVEGRALAAHRRDEFENIKKQGKWKEGIRAYLASISFADAQLGRLLDALEQSVHRENTIIVFWSDHGWHLGEKNHWHKSTLWEEATRIPFLITAPGITEGGVTCTRAVDTLSIYPTLLELCGFKPVVDLDGTSIVPLLKNPAARWTIPAVTEFQRGQCAVRTDRYRYIRYADGTEELYDHMRDPQEWTNISGVESSRPVIAELARWIPKYFAPNAPSKKAYHFDPHTYGWTLRKEEARK